MRHLVQEGIVTVAHDCTGGGLAVALAESCIAGGTGARIRLPGRICAAALFGEAPSRIVIAVSPSNAARASALLSECRVPYTELGRVEGDRLYVESACDIPVRALEEAWERTIPAAMTVPH